MRWMTLERAARWGLILTLGGSLPLLAWAVAWPYADMASGMVTSVSLAGALGAGFGLWQLPRARRRASTVRVLAILFSVGMCLLLLPGAAAIAFSVSQT